MDIQLLYFLAGCIVALIGIMYGAIQWEIRKLRKQGHMHANRLTEHGMALGLVLSKLGIDFKPRGGEE